MTKMLDGILLIGRVEAGALALTPLPIDVPRFCAELVDAMQESAGGRHRVELHVEGGWDDALADERLLSQILTNLLSNAIKYSPEGGAVDLFVRREGADAVLEVHDHGIGIPEGEHAKVFEGFHRASNARRIHGTGLGLAIVKRAAELHEGHVSFESEPGRGTRFTARIRVRGHRMAGEGGHAA